MAVINTNVNALFAQNALNSTAKLQTQAMQQLSSGLRINSAADDAAGIAIATSMSSQISGMQQAVQNANDAVTLIQTADGAVGSMTDMMQRMRELALEAANGTEDDTQRGYLDIEFQQLKQQIVDISNQTQWNGMDILNGTAGAQVGQMPVYKATSNNLSGSVFINPTTERTINGADSGEQQQFTLSGVPQQGTITVDGIAVNITPSDVAGGMTSVMQEIQNTLGQNPMFSDNSGRSVSADPTTGIVTLTFNSNDGATSPVTLDLGSTALTTTPVSVSRNAVTNTSENFNNNGKFLQSGTLSMSIPNGGTTVSAQFVTSDNKTIDLTGSLDTTTGQVTFNAADGNNSEVMSDNLTYTFQDSTGSALDLDTTPRALSLSVQVNGSIPAMRSGDLIINGTVIGPSQSSDDTLSPPNNAAGSAIAKAVAINRLAGPQGISQPEQQALTITGTPSAGTITVGGVSVTITSSDQTPQDVAKEIALALQGSSQFDSSTGCTVSVAQGSNVVNISYPMSSGNVGLMTFDPGSTGVTGSAAVTTPYATTTAGTGVYAKVNPNIVTGQAMDDSSLVNGVVFINGYASAQISNVLDNPQATRANVVDAINQISQETGVTAVDSGSDSQGVTLQAKDGRNIEVSFQTNDNASVFGAAVGLNQGVQCSTISLESKIDAPIVLTSSATGNISNVGLTDGDYSQNQAVLDTAARAPVQAVVPQQESVEIGGTVGANDTTSVIVNGQTFTSTGVTDPQTMRNNLIASINEDSTLGVYATAGNDNGQIILAANSPGVPFTMSATSSDPNNMFVTTNVITPNQPSAATPLQTNDLQINGVNIPQSDPLSDKLSNTVANSSDPASSAISVAAAINQVSSQTGVTAQANPVVSAGTNTNTDLPSSSMQSLYINGVQVQVNMVQGESGADRRAKVVAAINQLQGEDGVSATDNGSGVTLSSDGRNMSVWYDSSVPGLSSASFGLDKGGETAQVSKIAFSNGDSTGASVQINGQTITTSAGGDPSDMAAAMVQAINNFTPTSPNPPLDVTASLGSDGVSVLITANTAGNSFDLRGASEDDTGQTISLSTVTANSEGNNDVSEVNLSSAYSQNVLGGGNADANVRTLYGTVKLVAAAPLLPTDPGEDGLPNTSVNTSGDPIAITTGTNGVASNSNFSPLGFQVGSFGGRASEDMDPPRVGRLSFQVGSGANQAITIDLPDFGATGNITGAITGDISEPVDQRSVRINTQNGAEQVLNMLDAAMDNVSAQRANFGAVMNRLDYTVTNLTNVSNNTTTSLSSIQDADYASASTNLAKSQIMQQAATAVLAQANSAQQTVLKLLGS